MTSEWEQIRWEQPEKRQDWFANLSQSAAANEVETKRAATIAALINEWTSSKTRERTGYSGLGAGSGLGADSAPP